MKTETDDKGNEWKVIKSVGSVFGTTLNSKELSIALKNEVFHPDGAVILHLKTGTPYQVKLAYKCSDCENIHLLAFANFTEEIKDFLKDDIIYLDRSDSNVTIGDLIFLLDNFKDAQNISMECIEGEEIDVQSGSFTLAQVMKCQESECRNAHLTCYYEEEVS